MGLIPGVNRASDILPLVFSVGHTSSYLPETDCIGDDSAIFEDVFCLCEIALLGYSQPLSMERIQKLVLVGSATTRKELLLSRPRRHLSQDSAAILILLFR